MEDLINSLLHFSRLGRAELAWQRVDLNVLYHVGLIGRSISLSVARLSRFYIMCI
jgi:hypothetical protein